ncbi:hypothetical protein EOM86_07060 [Candidatus Nomurabacteria bacterium]|nr:hypothetical protein [Candidatus Nomurabacteria bacterium]
MSNTSNYTTTEDDWIGPAKFFLVEDDIVEDWYPRWYYIFENKTTGKMYLGQTRANIESYCGSGRYWSRHCKKHGGLNRFNVIAIWTRFFELEEDAKQFLKEFEEEHPNYWSHKNTDWANLIPESTDNYTNYVSNPELIERLRRRAYRSFGADNPSSKSVTIDGITYDSMRAASKATGLTIDYIRERYIKGIIRQEPTEEELLQMHENRSTASKKMWESDEYRAKWKESIDEVWTEDKRNEHSEKLKETWTKEEYRVNWKASIDEYWSDEENHRVCQERNKKAWENAEERRKHIGNISRELWKSEEYREKFIKGCYVTPFGKFAFPTEQEILPKHVIRNWCRDKCDSIVSGYSYSTIPWLHENYAKQDVVGKKTFRQLGFWFEEI